MTLKELEHAVFLKTAYNDTDFSEIFLDALRASGVDNWDGYDEAVSLYKTWLKEILNEDSTS